MIANHDDRFGCKACDRDLNGALPAMAASVFEKIAKEAVQKPGVSFDKQGFAWNGSQVRVERRTFFGEQANKIDALPLACGAGTGIETACQQNFAHKPIQFGDIPRYFIFLLLGR